MERGFRVIEPKAAAPQIDPSRRVTQWMSKTVFSAQPAAMLIEVYEIMNEHRVRHVPVIDGGRLVGIVSDRDLRNALPRRNEIQATGNSCWDVLNVRPISEVMTRLPFTIPSDYGIHEAAEIMCREKIGALPVMEDGRMIGIISTEDLLWALMQITGDGPRPQI